MNSNSTRSTKSIVLKKIIKDALKESLNEFKEELKFEMRKVLREEMSLSSINSKPINESQISSNSPVSDFKPIANQFNSEMAQHFKQEYESTSSPGHSAPTPGYNPGAVALPTAEGSSLPPGEISLDQITSLMGK